MHHPEALESFHKLILASAPPGHYLPICVGLPTDSRRSKAEGRVQTDCANRVEDGNFESQMDPRATVPWAEPYLEPGPSETYDQGAGGQDLGGQPQRSS